ncbi:hypothetical protein [Pseudoteredinibacter isoporae]|uniref:hypothetical protein n=1 Tax=Pseudoteredinibacter isoporae TaxID=570281 RepID=UPI0031064E66
MYKDIPFFFLHCIKGLVWCCLAITLFELFFAIVTTPEVLSDFDYLSVLTGWVAQPDINVRVNIGVFSPVLETLIFQVTLVHLIHKVTQNKIVITAFVASVFLLTHLVIYPTLSALGSSLACASLTYIYLESQKRIDIRLSAIASAIAYTLLSATLLYM